MILTDRGVLNSFSHSLQFRFRSLKITVVFSGMVLGLVSLKKPWFWFGIG